MSQKVKQTWHWIACLCDLKVNHPKGETLFGCHETPFSSFPYISIVVSKLRVCLVVHKTTRRKKKEYYPTQWSQNDLSCSYVSM